MKTLSFKILFFLFFLLLVLPEACWALQPHGEPEGLYVHQMAHILFMGALAYLYWHTRKTKDLVGKGWRYLQYFCLFLIAWNIVAFTGHTLAHYLEPTDIISKGTWAAKLAPPITVIKITYFLTRMDHFLNVPALVALLISLRTFYYEALEEAEK
ncbi:MAG: hypothetical protein KQH63_02295 [Desulfobulbaceae bacterium]|nr:hypothetical protein [Desulfobulbaceae bacterium]